MKKTTATLMLLAGLGGCASTDSKSAMGTKFNSPRKGAEIPGVMGPDGSPVLMTKQSKEVSDQMVGYVQKKAGDKTTKVLAKTKAPEIVQASATMAGPTPMDPMLQQSSGFSRIVGNNSGCADCNAHVPALGSRLHNLGHGSHGHQGGGDPYAYGPMGSGLGQHLGLNGVLPATSMGPYGAVAAVGAIGAGSPYGPAITNQRTAIKFVGPEKMRLSWLVGNNYVDSGLVAPASYNFMQGNIYRLKLSGIPTQASRTYYPTLEVAPATLKTITFLSHNSVPVSFTNDDLERVNAGNMVVKVIYLPDPAFQDAAALGGAEEVVSTQLEPGADPIAEATRRGTILAVIRLGNINLENQNSPAMDAVGGMPGMMGGPGMMAAPGMMAPPGMMSPPMMAPPAMMTPPTMSAAPAPMPSRTAPITVPSIPQVR
jgi:hypothetical protein